MLNAAGIVHCNIFIDSEPDEQLGDKHMPCIDPFRYLKSAVCEAQHTVVVRCDISVHAQLLYGKADAGLADRKLIGNIDGADVS